MFTQKACAFCGANFEAASAKAVYCTAAHRNAAYRKRQKGDSEADASAGAAETHQSSQDVTGLDVRAALSAELQAAKAEGTAMGQALLVMADRIRPNGESTGSELASMILRLGIELERVRERAATAAAIAGVEDEVGKARRERDRRRGVAG